jgi:amino acid adenylation domain-containing protein
MDQLSVLELFDRQVTGRPAAAAVVSGQATVTYRELDTRANRLAQLLRDAGVRRGDVVGICLGRDESLLVATLAVWKAGAAYLPLDPGTPDERLRFMCADAEARVVITQGGAMETGTPVLDLASVDLDVVAPRPALQRLHRSDAAYLIYTSGSTGRPKAVVVEHGPLAGITVFLGVAADPVDELHVAWLGSFQFDGSLNAILQICHGATVHVVPDEVRLDPESCVDYLVARGVRLVQCTPSQAALLADAGLLDRVGGPQRPFDLWLGGEPVPSSLWDRVNGAAGVRGVNWYGPTECTVDTTAARMSESAQPVIGRPLPGIELYVVDGSGRLVPPGVVGELWVGGRVARGYSGRPALTAQRFIADPFGDEPGGRVYRTGDLVRWDPDGMLEFLGRDDDQVNLRGYRIEPREIETVLLTHPPVRGALVVARSDGAHAGQLVAYLTGDPVSDEDLRVVLGRALPMADRVPLERQRED